MVDDHDNCDDDQNYNRDDDYHDNRDDDNYDKHYNMIIMIMKALWRVQQSSQ